MICVYRRVLLISGRAPWDSEEITGVDDKSNSIIIYFTPIGVEIEVMFHKFRYGSIDTKYSSFKISFLTFYLYI